MQADGSRKSQPATGTNPGRPSSPPSGVGSGVADASGSGVTDAAGVGSGEAVPVCVALPVACAAGAASTVVVDEVPGASAPATGAGGPATAPGSVVKQAGPGSRRL